MQTEGRKCGDGLMIPHHLEMYGKDRGADKDEYYRIRRWSVRATSN